MAVALPPFALPGISPSRGEIDKRLTPCPWNGRARHLISPLVGRCPAGQRGVTQSAKVNRNEQAR
jgi:hypothetical protein